MLRLVEPHVSRAFLRGRTYSPYCGPPARLQPVRLLWTNFRILGKNFSAYFFFHFFLIILLCCSSQWSQRGSSEAAPPAPGRMLPSRSSLFIALSPPALSGSQIKPGILASSLFCSAVDRWRGSRLGRAAFLSGAKTSACSTPTPRLVTVR